MKRKYELMFTIDAVLDDPQIEEIANKIRSSMEARGAEILDWNRWGKRRFAYEIKGRTHGVYYVILMMLPADQVREVELMLKLTEPVLRHLLLNITPRMEKLMIKQNRLKAKLSQEVSERAVKSEAASIELAGDERPQSVEEAIEAVDKISADQA
ncbi:MAG: 30S ribosomal protein S6 [bacterium]|nr:30S ribosomal protein S6 [bacterium]